MTVCPKFSHSDRILTKLMKRAAFLSTQNGHNQSGQTLIALKVHSKWTDTYWMCVRRYPYLVPLKVDIHFYTRI